MGHSDKIPKLSPEMLDAVSRYAEPLAGMMHRVLPLLVGFANATQQQVFILATQFPQLLLIGFLLPWTPNERRAILELVGKLNLEQSQELLAAVAAVEKLSALRRNLAHVWPSAFRPIPKVFVSYQTHDAWAEGRLRQVLSMLLRRGDVRLLEPELGVEQRIERQARLQESDLVILLISPHYLQSDDSYAELSLAVNRMESGQARVLPILLEPTPLWGTPVADLQMLPRGRSIQEAGDAGWLEVEAGVREVLTRMGVFQAEQPSLPAERTPPTFFVLSTQEDSAARDWLLRVVRPLERVGQIRLWHEGMILPGDSIPKESEKQFASAFGVIVLLSIHLLAQDQAIAWLHKLREQNKRSVWIPVGGGVDMGTLGAELRQIPAVLFSTLPDGLLSMDSMDQGAPTVLNALRSALH